jgi:hypothetical protein
MLKRPGNPFQRTRKARSGSARIAMQRLCHELHHPAAPAPARSRRPRRHGSPPTALLHELLVQDVQH